MKKRWITGSVLLFLVWGYGCFSVGGGANDSGNTPLTDTEAVAADVASTEITFSGGDTVDSVTGNLILPETGSNGSTITWTSNQTQIIANDGTVTQPPYGTGGFEATGVAVTLTAEVLKNGVIDTKVFYLTVFNAPPVAGDVMAFDPGGIPLKMVYIPGKTTFTGTTDATQATVNNGYEIAETEVTYELWSAVYTWAIANGYTFVNSGRQGGDLDGCAAAAIGTSQSPVTCINWRDAMVWMNALTEYYNNQNGTSLACVYTSDPGYNTPIRVSSDGNLDGTAGSFDNPYVNPDAKGFRLPANDEWELAARYIDDANSDGDIMDAGEYYPADYASGATAAHTDFVVTNVVAWFGRSVSNDVGNTASTQPVKQKAANALGLFDMSGNAWEWCFDWHPSGGGVARTSYGGSWYNFASGIVLSSTYMGSPYVETVAVGFRPARTP